ncbi:SH3 domain-containing protein [Candidatus Thiothrix sp. Deng01]|uniref:SH3 domain-containing protein n=1 Tax=Candidatus Thiothrix phosphatis TaxID=3112415 RepID=A0ABU6CU00_9GAMM|nr:SH3 domain-containing protein [Candidatus Thiothrix sp. Deng01]MEB4590306.1 SH3 domain-containing protein [Candidatus Thiothrix sp. Deng01]
MRKPSFVMAAVLTGVLLTSTAALPPSHAAEPEVFAVTGVRAGDFLNMRSGPGVSNAITGRIPANGQGVVATGEEQKISGTIWVKVYWAGVGGWVNKQYLLPEAQASAIPPTSTPPSQAPPAASDAKPELVLNCAGTEPFWRIDISANQLKVNMNDGPQYNVPVTFRQTSANNTSIAVIAGEKGTDETQAFMQKVESCSDGMSDVSYPYAITAVLNNRQVISGCCKVQ